MPMNVLTRAAGVSSAAMAAVSVCAGVAAAVEPALVPSAATRTVQAGTAPSQEQPVTTQWVPLGSLLFSDRNLKSDVTPVRWVR